MSGLSRSSADFDARRRRILYRSWHRGMREMDLIMGRFAEEKLNTMSDAELDVFELLIEVPDRDLLAWITEQEPVPANYHSGVFEALKRFHTHSKPIHA
jgi:antitoxin CptB